MSKSPKKIGDIFGRLTIEREKGRAVRPGTSDTYPVFVCRCACGNAVDVLSCDLPGKKSCGCLLQDALKKGQAILAARRLPKDKAALNALYRYYKNNAKRRSLKFSLECALFQQLIVSPCHYCSNPPQTPFRKHGITYGVYNGIDRLDNDLGYTVTNTVTCCAACNRLKGTFSTVAFLKQIIAVHCNLRRASKVVGYSELKEWRNRLTADGKTVAVASGCFDIIHFGHVKLLNEASERADVLMVGINSDRAVAQLKGPSRPVNNQHSRMSMLTAFECVDNVAIFDDTLAVDFLRCTRPDVWIKGGDYTLESLNQEEVGVVRSSGGKVEIFPTVPGASTTALLQAIRAEEKLILSRLHAHPKMQSQLGVPQDHVIIDRNEYEKLVELFGHAPDLG